MSTSRAFDRVVAKIELLAFAVMFGCVQPACTAVAENQPRVEIVPAIGHFGVSSLALSGDGRRAVTVGGKVIKLWDIASGRLLRSFVTVANINAVALSPDGQYVVAASADGLIKVWAAVTGRQVRSLTGHHGPVSTIAISPDGRFLASGSSSAFDAGFLSSGTLEKTLLLWDWPAGTLIHTFDDFDYPVTALAFSPDGKYLVSGGRTETALFGRGDYDLRLWDIESKKLINSFEGHETAVTALAFSPDGRYVASGAEQTEDEDGKRKRVDNIRLWSISGTALRSLSGHTGTVQALAFSRNGEALISAGGKSATTWATSSGKMISRIDYSRSHETSFGLSNDGTQALVAETARASALPHIGVWMVGTKQLSRSLIASSTPVTMLLGSRDGRHAILFDKMEQRISALTEPKGMEALTRKYSAEMKEIAKSRDLGKMMEWIFGLLIERGILKTVPLWDLSNGRLRETEFPIRPAGAEVTGRRAGAKGWFGLEYHVPRNDLLSSDKQFVVSAEGNRPVLRDAKTNRLVRTFSPAPGKEIGSVRYTPNGKWLFDVKSCLFDKSSPINVWDAQTGKFLHSLKGPCRLFVSSPAISPDDRLMVLVSELGSIQLWDIERASVARDLEGRITESETFTFSLDGRRVFSTGSQFRLWDVGTGRSIPVANSVSTTSSLDVSSSFVFNSLGFSHAVDLMADGYRVLVGGDTAQLWDIREGKLLARLVLFTNGDWVVLTPEGFFDASPKGAEMLSVVRGFEVYSIDQAYASLYRPDLVREKLAGDPNGRVKEAAAKLDLDQVIASGAPPAVEITSPGSGSTVGTDEVTVELTLTDRGGGIGKTEWRVNGVTLGLDARGADPDRAAPPSTVTRRRTFTLDPGVNQIDVVAYNARNLIASVPAVITVRSNDNRLVPPRLYVLAVGINDYWDGRLRLNHAATDARAVAAALGEAGKRGLYSAVEVITVVDTDVTVVRLDQIFSELSKKMRASDVFVFYAAGHGKTVDGRYYFIPQDFRYEGQHSILAKAIDEDQFQQWLVRIPARKSVLIYDTCESGTLTGEPRVVVRGTEQVERDRALLDRLIRATGRTILTAAREADPALEGYRGHGIFTYALLEGLAQADDNRNGTVEMSELARYLDVRVPEISRQAFGWRQVPQMKQMGSDFALVKVTAVMSSQAPQTPGPASLASHPPTHVVIAKTIVRQAANGTSRAVLELAAGTSVLMLDSSGGWYLIAREGKKIGYVPKETVAKLQ